MFGLTSLVVYKYFFFKTENEKNKIDVSKRFEKKE